LDRARNVTQSQMIQQLQTTGRVADLLNSYNHYLHDPGYLQKDYERYQKVTIGDVKRRAETGLTKDSRVVVYGLPGRKVLNEVAKTPPEQEPKEEPAKSTAPEEAWRAKPPEPGPAPKLVLPVAKVFKLQNGLSVYLVERHKLPLMSVGLVIA